MSDWLLLCWNELKLKVRRILKTIQEVQWKILYSLPIEVQTLCDCATISICLVFKNCIQLLNEELLYSAEDQS